MNESEFLEVSQNVFKFVDAINVYAIKNNNRAILIDFGSGEILNHLPKIGIDEVEYIFHTHYHRDQCYGDHKALQKKIKIAAPHKERKLFNSAEDFWKTRSYYNIYYFKPTFFVSTYNIPLNLTFKDGDIFNWGPYRFKIIRTDGHTSESISYLMEHDDELIAFTGDLLHSNAKVITYYDLQYIYNDNGEGGIKRSFKSFKKLMAHQPDLLLPSHGDIITNPKNDIEFLKKKFERARFSFCSEFSGLDIDIPQLLERAIKPVDMKKEFPHIFHGENRPPFLIMGTNKNCILIDFAGDDEHGYELPQFNEILKNNNVERIDFILPSHYHDDHTSGIPILQKEYDLKVHALENMVDILENPTHYRLGCLMDKSIKIDQILRDGEIFKWDDYEFQIFHFPGQTEYHMGLFGKIDGKTIFFTGDSIGERSFTDRDTNLNGLNFCQLGENVGYMKCADILLQCNPQYIAISHYGIIKVNRDLLKKFKEYVSEYWPVIQDIVAQENPNFGLDPNWICFKPIRIITKPGSEFQTNLIVRNYLSKQALLEFELNLPENWIAYPSKSSIKIKPKTFEEIPISISIPTDVNPKGRTIITANIKWNNKNLGPFPDLMIDHGFIPSDSWKAWNPGKKENLLLWILNSIRRLKRMFR
ncbi:MAG: MBL fold metallo-hydrolase [Promethearchaeota archaeon]|nr:MAG: MBL fold metallo-hydrolase [Candidatus Lokiarchaeota archaeon]